MGERAQVGKAAFDRDGGREGRRTIYVQSQRQHAWRVEDAEDKRTLENVARTSRHPAGMPERYRRLGQRQTFRKKIVNPLPMPRICWHFQIFTNWSARCLGHDVSALPQCRKCSRAVRQSLTIPLTCTGGRGIFPPPQAITALDNTFKVMQITLPEPASPRW